MRLNSKGQVTIPADIREKCGPHARDEVDVIEEDCVLRIVRRVGGGTRGQRPSPSEVDLSLTLFGSWRLR
ncbi:AbrB/MazE/SpoVT family DNA-binding domain-containing protein [Kitasatospora sp. NPDC094016]|uniref:AbrB/MazE/SpoVT family DNA-binding domain-containing protein n=1 Tax=Kitasatospora sp. NPDC094016 TaxID=3154986 RepID=UPI00331A7815